MMKASKSLRHHRINKNKATLGQVTWMPQNTKDQERILKTLGKNRCFDVTDSCVLNSNSKAENRLTIFAKC